MDETRARDTGRLALAVGAVAAGSAACLATFFVAGQPFGTINDIGNATAAILSGGLAWRLRGQLRSRAAGTAVGAALVGAGISVAGSALVVSGTTGFFLAGLVSSLGSAGIGAWLIAANRSESAASAWPRSLRRIGIVAGALMAAGIVAVPTIALQLDDMASAPAWVWIGFLSWFGTYVVYPAWAIWMGIVETRRAAATVAPAGTAVAR